MFRLKQELPNNWLISFMKILTSCNFFSFELDIRMLDCLFFFCNSLEVIYKMGKVFRIKVISTCKFYCLQRRLLYQVQGTENIISSYCVKMKIRLRSRKKVLKYAFWTKELLLSHNSELQVPTNHIW